MLEQEYLILDYETGSESPLGKVGAWEYSLHSSTHILCVSYRKGTRETLSSAPVKTWSPFTNTAKSIKADLVSAILDPDVIKVAHNAFFEQAITAKVLPRYSALNIDFPCPPPREWICTSALAAALALPRALEGACAALGLTAQKDMAGHKLMLKMSKPRKATKLSDAKWHRDPEDFEKLIAYCEADIRAETELFLKLPPLNPLERKVWELDQKINLRGVRIDRPLVKAIIKMVNHETQNLNDRLCALTNGEVEKATKTAQLKKWMEAQGAILPNMQAKTLTDAVAEGDLPEKVASAIKIRQAVGKVSIKKYPAMEMRSRSDGFVRDILMYWGASTGRFSGRGLQIHNLPQGDRSIDTIEAVKIVRLGDLEFLRALYNDPMNLFSSCVRSAIIPPEKEIFFRGDFSSIEVRVLFWLAGNEAGLEAYRKKADLYKQISTRIFNVALDRVTKEQREVGKRAILGSGYGMGAKKFEETCAKYGQPVSSKLAQTAIDTYRSVHHQVPELWYKMEAQAIKAVKHPHHYFTCGKVKWLYDGQFLWCTLPSGRKLAYHRPAVKIYTNDYGYKNECLFHYGVHPTSKKQWIEQRTWGGILVENVTQAVARDLLVEAMLRLESAGYRIAMTVHDEILSSKLFGSEKEFGELMKKVAAWGLGIPVECEVWSDNRYKK